MPDIHDVTNDALRLAPVQRAELIESLLASFDPRRGAMDKLWGEEAERRVDAYDQKQMMARSADVVLKEIGQQKK